MNYYLKKRLHNNIARSDMASMLGVDYKFYQAIEEGSVKMPLNLIDKFNEIINKGKENDIIGVENTIKADEFWEKMHQKDETGRWILVSKMHEFNINNYDELVKLLGYKSVGTIYNYLQGRNPVGSEFKKRLYTFFSDEKNIQIPRKEIKKPRYKINNPPRKPNKELDKYYKETNFKKIMRDNYITNVQIANAIGVHNSTVSNMTCKKYKPSYNIIQKVKDYLDNNTTNWIPSESQETLSDKYISKTLLLSKCNDEIATYQASIDEYTKQINELTSKLELVNKIVDMIDKM